MINEDNELLTLTYGEIVEIFRLWQDDYLADDEEAKLERSKLIEDENYGRYCASYFISLANVIMSDDDGE